MLGGAFGGKECSVLKGPLIPWKPEKARENLKEDGVKVPGGSGRWSWGRECWVLGTGDVT